MFRNRLKGGHRVGAPNTLTQRIQGPSTSTPSAGGWGLPQQNYGVPPQPGQPQQPLHQQHAPNTSGWDSSWSWGDSDNYSNNSSQGSNLQQQSQQTHLNQPPQHVLNEQYSQPTLPPYNSQPQSYSSQQLPPTSQPVYAKPVQNTSYNYQHHVNSSSSSDVYQTSHTQLPTHAQQQFVNGSKQNGEWNNDWGNDNWGSDWGQAESYGNNNRSVNYNKQEQQYQSQQQFQQQQNEYQQSYQAQGQVYHEQNLQQEQQLQPQPQLAHQEVISQHQHSYEGQIQHQQEGDLKTSQQSDTEHQHYYQQQQHGAGNGSTQLSFQTSQQYSHPEQHNQQPMEIEQQQQMQQHHSPPLPQQAAEEEWGWGGYDWEATKKKEDAEPAINHQVSHSLTENQIMNSHSQERAAENRDGLELSHSENGVQQTAKRDIAEDGWPDWENDVAQGSDQQQQKLECPKDPAVVGENIPTIDQEKERQHTQEQSDDGLESAYVHYSNTQNAGEVPIQEASSKHIKTEAWDLDNNKSEAVPSSAEVISDASTVPFEENSVHLDRTPSDHEHQYLQSEVSHYDVKTNSPSQALSVTSAQALQNLEDYTTNLVGVPAVADNWDDDGWGDGWEAEAPVSQEKPTEENPPGIEFGSVHHEFDDRNSHPVNSYIPNQNSGADMAVGATSSEKGESLPETYPNNSVIGEVAVGEGNCHSSGNTSEYQQFSHGHHHQEDGSASAGWDDGLGQVISDSQSSDVTSNDMGNSITHGMHNLMLEEQTEAPGTQTSTNSSDYQEDNVTMQSMIPSLYQQADQSPLYHQSLLEGQTQSTWSSSPNSSEYQPFSSMPTSTMQPQNISEQHDTSYEAHILENQYRQHIKSSQESLLVSHPQSSESPLVHTSIQNQQSGIEQSSHPESSDVPQREMQLHSYATYSSTQYQGLNQEVVEEPYYSQIPDPMVSRIPDGASSVADITPSLSVTAGSENRISEEAHGDMRHSLSEGSERPSSVQSAQSVSSQPTCGPSQPLRPPSAHTIPDRPSSNQSAHSVHSAYSNRSTQSSHSLLNQNQEVPPPHEGTRNSASHSTFLPTGHQEASTDGFVHGSTYTSNNFAPYGVSSIQELPADGKVDPTAPPTNNPVAPPPLSGPIGTVTSLRARKGSPFQPPPVKRPPLSQSQTPPIVSQSSVSHAPPVSVPSFPDMSANLEMLPDNNEKPVTLDRNTVPLWTSSDNLTSNVKLAVAAPSFDNTHTSSSDNASKTNDPNVVGCSSYVSNNPIPLVIPGMLKDEPLEAEPIATSQSVGIPPDIPLAHNTHPQPVVAMPKVQPLSAASDKSSPGVLDLSRTSGSMNKPRGDGSRDQMESPNFSRMVPGESSKGESTTLSTYQAPVVVPSMPSERVVTGNDDPQPALPVRIKQEPSEIRSPPDGPYTSDLSGQGANVIPPVRSETIGSEEPASRNFPSSNSGSRADLSNDHREHRNDRAGRWERDHSRDRDRSSGNRYREKSRERSRDYYRDDSPHSRRSYDHDYDFKYDSDRDRRGWRHDSEDDEDGDRRYYESRDRRDRAYRDELDRYSDRPVKDEKERTHRENSRDRRRDYRDRSRDYRSYDDDPYYGRSDRSQPVSRSSSINNLDNEGDRSGHSHRSRHDYYDRHDRRDSRSRDSDHRDRDGSYSRTHRDRDSSFSRDGRDPRRDMRYYGQRGYEDAYGSRDLYEHYQYYYQYYRDHPYYKDYYRQWMKQYGHAYPSHDSFYDDRTSIHSGRSSVNDELKKSISSGELSGVPSVGGDSASEAPQRLTPVKYGRPIINARFTPGGGLLFVLPKDPRDGEKAVVQIRDVQKMLCMDPTLNRSVKQMKLYPGPLTLADTHKDVVVRYCEQQAAEASKNYALPDGESVVLIWEYLALLVKQNGKLYGSDVAGLLLKGQDRTLPSQQKFSASNGSAEDVSETPPVEVSPQDEGFDSMSQSQPPPRDEALLLKKFTEYLCLGRKKEAVDYAMHEGLWGHALALSFKMDSTTHTRVLAAFSNSIPRNDILLTLFQQLSGKKPEVTKSYTPQQWGSWRHHLAMMVSNPTGQSQRDKASIISLGETLAARGQLHAAHFCYLVAEADWGCFSNKQSKLVLIGSSHHLPFQSFATNEAIQCTEIYEFAKALDSNNPVLETFQSYKFIYALRLAEYGFPAEALRYCEVIGQIAGKSPSSYQGDFLSQVYELASRLKYHDLHYQMCEGEMAEMPDPQWLLNLHAIVTSVKHQEAEQLASQDYHLYNQSSTAASGYQNSSATPDLYHQTAGTNITSNYQQGFNAADSTYQPGQSTPDPYQGSVSTSDVIDGAYHQQRTPVYTANSLPSSDSGAVPVGHTDINQSNESGSHGQENPGSVPMMMQPQASMDQSQYAPYGNSYWPGYSSKDPSASSPHMQPDASEVSHSSLPPSSDLSNDHQPNDVTSMSQPNSLSSYPSYPPQPYQPWDQHQQQHEQLGSDGVADHSQSRSPDLSGAPQRTPEEEAYWADMMGKKTSNEKNESGSKEKEKTEDEKKMKKEKDSDSSQDKNSGWFIGSLFGWKKSKQAVLPDDKNPSIIWNEEKKRWENKDGVEEMNAPPPPPKLSAGGPGAPPLSLTRGGPRKSRYVNTEKDAANQASNGPSNMMPPPLPGGIPLPGGPPPMMPGRPSMPSNFMVPEGIPQPQERESSSPQQPQNVQNPNEKQNAPLLTSVPDTSLGTSNDGGEGAVPMMAPPGQPQFFNPNQFNPPTSAPNPVHTRRVGPGKRLYQGKR
ncbi:hypothetical protein SK128_025546 [Halocaridina rubra]|uniref:Sec16 Sec23-binding domain-containing protein n=1 Tax=Halocaridina rubra TaxID=373956 RepID=A0AAN8XEE1_HALRR